LLATIFLFLIINVRIIYLYVLHFIFIYMFCILYLIASSFLPSISFYKSNSLCALRIKIEEKRKKTQTKPKDVDQHSGKKFLNLIGPLMKDTFVPLITCVF